ncbi:MAG: hypothetical protein HY694_04350 [Deltaproteobacteria bacterium]|nr:hypothetical protein [Deltaproteobacteria bacterium]
MTEPGANFNFGKKSLRTSPLCTKFAPSLPSQNQGFVISSGVTPSILGFPERVEIQDVLPHEINEFDVLLCDTWAQLVERSVKKLQQQFLEKITEIGQSSSLDRIEMELGIEREIVVCMSPLSRKSVKVRAEYIGRAKPSIVFDPVPED